MIRFFIYLLKYFIELPVEAPSSKENCRRIVDILVEVEKTSTHPRECRIWAVLVDD